MKPKPLESLNHLTVPVAMLRFLCTGLKNRAEPVMQGNQGGEVTTEEPLYGHYVQPFRCLTFLQAALYRQFFPAATDFLNSWCGWLSDARVLWQWHPKCRIRAGLLLHFPAERRRRIFGRDFDVVPADQTMRGNRPHELHAVR